MKQIAQYLHERQRAAWLATTAGIAAALILAGASAIGSDHDEPLGLHAATTADTTPGVRLVSAEPTYVETIRLTRATRGLSSEMKQLVTRELSTLSAKQVKGCHSKVHLRGDVWTQESFYTVPGVHGLPEAHVLDLSAMLVYWFCPNAGSAKKVMGKWTENCWFFATKDDEEHFWFDGVRFGTKIYDNSDRISDAGIRWVKDDGTRQNCSTNDIEPDEEIWMRMRDYPCWMQKSHPVVSKWDDPSWAQWTVASKVGPLGCKSVRPKHDMHLDPPPDS